MRSFSRRFLQIIGAIALVSGLMVPVDFASNRGAAHAQGTQVVGLSAGGAYSMALLADGTVWGWGKNDHGQLGNGETTEQHTPVPVKGLSGIAKIDAGFDHALALGSDKTVWGWGNNGSGELGTGTTNIVQETPTRVPGLRDIVDISAGYGFSLALNSDGTVWAWGFNYFGALGDGTTVDRYSPVRVSQLTDIQAIAAGQDHALALGKDGRVWAWGDNRYGQLGDGTTTNRYIPVQIPGLSGIVAVASGQGYSLALKDDGSVWAWGDNRIGELGLGTATDGSNTPQKIPGLYNITAIDAGPSHAVALKADGSAWAWSNNYYGQLGDGTRTQREAPTRVLGLSNVSAIVAGEEHSLAVDQAGTLWAWGRNEAGELGNGTTSTGESQPIKVPFSIPTLSSLYLSSGTLEPSFDPYRQSYSVGVASDVESITVYAEPSDPQSIVVINDKIGATQTIPLLKGQNTLIIRVIDPNSSISRTYTIQIERMPFPNETGVSPLSAGTGFSMVLFEDGSVWGFGDNTDGELGDGTSVSHSTPVPVHLSSVVAIDSGEHHTLALKSDGTVWAWGANPTGEIGNGEQQTIQETPTPVVGLTGAIAVAAGGQHSLALDSNGHVWAWGFNSSGQLGDGTHTQRNTPVQVQGLSDVAAIAAGDNFSLALKKDGTVWSWGSDQFGQLGNGTQVGSPTPVKVIGLSGVEAISAGGGFALALRYDGTVWAWGGNAYGILGDGTFSDQESPVQVQRLTDVIAIDASYQHSMALEADGTVWSWGNNDYGMLGDGTTVDRLVPTKINSLSNVFAIAAGVYHSLAATTDGTIWAWGTGSAGELGDGLRTEHHTPVPVRFEQTSPPSPLLESLSLSGIPLSPAFDPQVASYSANVSADVDSVSVHASPKEPDATVRINGLSEQTATISLTTGPNRITIEIVASDGSSKTYTIVVTRTEKTRSFPSYSIGGQNRYDTSVQLLTHDSMGWTKGPSDNVIIVNGAPGHEVDALAANSLAGALGAPVVVVNGNGNGQVSAQADAFIRPLQAKKAFIVGGVMGEGVLQHLQKDLGLAVEQLKGQDRYQTAAAVAKYIQGKTGAKPKQIFLTTGTALPDALSAGPVAAAESSIVLLIHSTGDNNAAIDTANKLKQLYGATVYALGGNAVVPTDVVEKTHAQRVPGETRYDTNLTFLKCFENSFDPQTIYVTNAAPGHEVDALSAGSVAGQIENPLLLTDGKQLTKAQSDWLKAYRGKASNVVFVGKAFSDTLKTDVEGALEQ
ncbi:MAG: cell wall-binding repeat-containing protein [Firmicutes bacterium]|nr:cell wall-binding repeat-containing protein [Bacillota bacterium]